MFISEITQLFLKRALFKWRVTSYIRGTPDTSTHARGKAVDVAPDFETYPLAMAYAVRNNRNPFLYLRRIVYTDLLLRSKALNLICERHGKAILLAIEEDHIHIMELQDMAIPTQFPRFIKSYGSVAIYPLIKLNNTHNYFRHKEELDSALTILKSKNGLLNHQDFKTFRNF